MARIRKKDMLMATLPRHTPVWICPIRRKQSKVIVNPETGLRSFEYFIETGYRTIVTGNYLARTSGEEIEGALSLKALSTLGYRAEPMLPYRSTIALRENPTYHVVGVRTIRSFFPSFVQNDKKQFDERLVNAIATIPEEAWEAYTNVGITQQDLYAQFLEPYKDEAAVPSLRQPIQYTEENANWVLL